MKQHEIEYPRIKEFKRFPEAVSYVQERNTKLVFKPSGNLPCKLTYCASDPEEMIGYLKFVEKYYSKEIEDFILQDFIEGKVVSTEFWVGPKGFIHPANHTVEVKKFMNDNLGPSTGCQGNLVWIADDDQIVEQLLKIEDSLIRENYCGPIDLNAIINEKSIYGLEWTPRFGLDAMPSLLQQVDEIGKLISDLLQGTVHEMNSLKSEFSGGIRLSIPPYPAEPERLKNLEKEVPSIGVPVDDLSDYAEKCYFYEVKCEDGQFVHSSGTGVIAVISDIGDNSSECFLAPEEILEEVKIPDKQYRTDISKVLSEMYCDTFEILEQGIEI